LKRVSFFLAAIILSGGVLAYYRWVYLPAHPKTAEFAYILPDSVTLLDSRAEIHRDIATLKSGERVEVLSTQGDWAEVLTPSGDKGWLEADTLLDSQVYEAGARLLNDLKSIPVQAQGHTTFRANLRLVPSRDGALLAKLKRNEKLEVFRRRVVPKSDKSEDESDAPITAGPDVWYLIKSGPRAGWIFGRLVTLDIPDDLAGYAENYNMVAWLVLNTVDVNGQKVPQYVAADREENPEYDFSHVRVFTWSEKQGRYATAFVQSHLKGFFPILVTTSDGMPEFRLRLEDAHGLKIQKVYRLDNTIVRPLGIVEGWDSNAMPAASERRSSRRRGRP
jgi:Bacterial SH3 domain